MLRIVLSLFLGLTLATAAAGADDTDTTRIKAELARAFPRVSFESAKLTPAPVAGLYEVELDTQVFYVTGDGKFVLFGDLVDLNTRASLTEERRGKIVSGLFDQVGEQNMIVIAPRKTKRTITVFTDVDCPYCAKLHLDVPELNKHGVKVRYLLYPRNGLGTETYRRSVAVWCAPDRVKAVGIAKAGGKLELKTCPNPVEQIYRLGQRVEISGTPTIFLDNGRRLAGYVAPARLLALLGLAAE
ncbi:MAG: hypothetical protein A2637_03180 [Candidatus Muproteobacteria bacterium RIFCSPHIGHO2_01_FULL_65_16]|uniref:Thiol:disulfide interchange protein n=2 Tax=Candidatus Muproteobacteria TaxID=1817795 RepID=A0A1F6TGY2_9PROT|nr:MAG: hypothetical protein A2V92_03355 [Candidatus Muproteobacteria bacterium RBG_16_65_31]OGI47583.1 MAG: hypothetical protein A2637_03180 [Candidatus Muproteobacteria bacterium RIFCSPHIGHO2_01_FULL_65_16]